MLLREGGRYLVAAFNIILVLIAIHFANPVMERNKYSITSIILTVGATTFVIFLIDLIVISAFKRFGRQLKQ
jgi:hypothetical protein